MRVLAVLLVARVVDAAVPTVILEGTPFVHQKPDFCGEADVEMALGRLGHHVTQDEVFALSGVDPLKGRGAYTDELARALRALGVEPGRVWSHFTARDERVQLQAMFTAIVDDLRLGQPSIVCMHYDARPATTEHFRLVTGYDAATDEIVYQEPAIERGADQRMAREAFLNLMLFKPRAEARSLIRFRLPPPAKPPEIAKERPPTRAQLAQTVMTLQKTLPTGATLSWQKPFLVIGDEDKATVERRARDQVRWARDLLLADFFTEAPDHIEQLWVLKDAHSYERVSKDVFGMTPDTPYGYYLSSRTALIMNIKPGYGTLVHEMVHPFVHQNWPQAPAWLNEGLASLFEFPFEEGGHLKGRVNWRLPGLKVSLQRGTAPAFKTLTHFDTEAFYDDPYGTHYAQARYLCYWLQQRGLLVKFIVRAQALKGTDGTGWQALTEVLGQDPDALFETWAAWVKALDQRS